MKPPASADAERWRREQAREARPLAGRGPSRHGIRALAILSLFAGTVPARAAFPAEPPPSGGPGAWIESVAPGSLGERAGLRPGDRVTGWRREASFPGSPIPAAGAVASPFDLEAALREEAPRGALELGGVRAGRPFRAGLPAGASLEGAGLESRPALAPPFPARLAEARSASRRGDPEGAAEILTRAARDAFGGDEAEAGLWLLREGARVAEGARHFAVADAAFRRAATAFELRSLRREAVELLVEWARSLDRRLAWEEAEARLLEAEGLLGAGAAAPLALANVLHERGEVARHRDDYPAAGRHHRRGLALRSLLAPGSLDAAASAFGVGRVVAESGEGDPVPLVAAAEATVRRLDPWSRTHRLWLVYLGQALVGRDPAAAESCLREALAAARRREPGGYSEALAQSRLGALLDSEGASQAAMRLLEEALATARALPPDFLHRYLRATLLQQLAHLAAGQGDAARAYDLALEAVDLQRQLRPGSLGLALALDALGRSAWIQRRLGEAGRLYGESLALLERLVPESPTIAHSLTMLARVAAGEGREGDAARFLERARPRMKGELARGRYQAGFLLAAADVAARAGRPDEAVGRSREAVAFLERLDPADFALVEALASLAFYEREAEEGRAFREAACRGVERVELRARMYGADDEARLRLARGYSDIFALCAEALLGEGRPEEAFRAAESGRARALLDLLARRDLDLGAVPAGLRGRQDELVRRREEAAAALEEAVAAGEGERAAAQRRKLGELDAEQERLAREAYRSASDYAGLRYPRPLPLEAVRAALDPGTLLLEYVVSDRKTFLFLVRPASAPGPAVETREIALGAAALEGAVRDLRSLAASPLSDPDRFARASRALYALLLAPAEGAIERSERLVIAPDGPLHVLPFAALERADGRPLAAWRALHLAPSATVYAQARMRRHPPADPVRLRIAAFGDPAYGAEPEAGSDPPRPRRPSGRKEGEGALDLLPATRGAAGRLPLLPASRAEVEGIRALFPQTRAFLGEAATEAAARSLDREVDVVHFAVHALLDARLPGLSSLALSPPPAGSNDGTDGRLEVTEIVSSLRLDASLVTLSACQTALGREMGGEGLVGLTRAFLFAGARTVLGSLWAVGDRPTERAMRLFYAGLRAGLDKDEALRRAQAEMLADPATAHPSNWAGFVLVGDFR